MARDDDDDDHSDDEGEEMQPQSLSHGVDTEDFLSRAGISRRQAGASRGGEQRGEDYGSEQQSGASESGAHGECGESMARGESSARSGRDEGTADQDLEEASEYLIRLRRSGSPQGSLIATRIARVLPRDQARGSETQTEAGALYSLKAPI